MIFYRTVQAIVQALRPLVVRPLDISGLEHIPASGPFILAANHQSYLDPILIQGHIRRRVHAMAKSTQFTEPITGWFLKRLRSFPVRRFQVDPQAVRLALRYIEAGEGVGIYIEGERSWDGNLQPPRLGTLRLMLRAGVPVVPCGISGAYRVWPRWDSRIRPAGVQIRFGPPILVPALHDRDARERALPDFHDRLVSAIADLAHLQPPVYRGPTETKPPAPAQRSMG